MNWLGKKVVKRDVDISSNSRFNVARWDINFFITALFQMICCFC